VQAQKRKAEEVDEGKKQGAKKKKRDPVQLRAIQAAYLSQVRGLCEAQVQNVTLQSSGKRHV
jgi:hypothetical protein